MEKLVGGLLYFGTILTTLAMLGVTPTVLLSLGIGYCRGKRSARSMLIALCFPAAYVIGGIIGWTFRPFHWNMSFKKHYGRKPPITLLSTTQRGFCCSFS